MGSIWLPIVVGLVTSIVLAIVFKNRSKVDRGFAVNYFKLSYRRKLIRTLWMLPFSLLALFFIYYISVWGELATISIMALFIIVYVMQLLYNLYKYQQHEA